MNKSSSKNRDRLSLEEEESLFREMQAGSEEARNIIILRHQWLVIWKVNQLVRGDLRNFDDLIRAGNVGLAAALSRWDFKKGRFAAYAGWFVVGAIVDQMYELNSPIAIPKHLRNNLKKIRKALESLLSEGIENPSISELSAKAGISLQTTVETFELIDPSCEPVDGKKMDGSGGIVDPGASLTDKNMDDEASKELDWEFQLEDYGFIYRRIETTLLQEWKKTRNIRAESYYNLSERRLQFQMAVHAPNRCLRRRLVLANGSRGMLDTKILEELNRYTSGSEIYDRRKFWKDHSPF